MPREQILCHDSGEHGQFSKADKLAASKFKSINQHTILQSEVVAGTFVIFRWIDKTEDSASINCNRYQLVNCKPGKQAGNTSAVEMQGDSSSDSGNGDCFLWLAHVISVEGSPTSPTCKLHVRWCPNNKLHTWRTRLSENDTFLQQYPYREAIKKKNCIAINLRLTIAIASGGKFDHRHKFDDGTTCKDVARCALEEFYAAN